VVGCSSFDFAEELAFCITYIVALLCKNLKWVGVTLPFCIMYIVALLAPHSWYLPPKNRSSKKKNLTKLHFFLRFSRLRSMPWEVCMMRLRMASAMVGFSVSVRSTTSCLSRNHSQFCRVQNQAMMKRWIFSIRQSKHTSYEQCIFRTK
jgi:hypothetical protein